MAEEKDRLETDPSVFNQWMTEIILKSALGVSLQRAVERSLADKAEIERIVNYALRDMIQSVAKEHLKSQLGSEILDLVEEALRKNRNELQRAAVEAIMLRLKHL